MEDELILVDVLDTEVGSCSKMETHIKGFLHRAFSVFVVHDGKMLLQKRNSQKYHSGGLWTNACCSHPRNGETMQVAVSRRLIDELGVTFPVRQCFDFVYRAEFGNGIIEFEYDHVYLADYCGEINPNSEEIEELRWIELSKLKEELTYNPEQFTAWFVIAAPRVLKMINEENAL